MSNKLKFIIANEEKRDEIRLALVQGDDPGSVDVAVLDGDGDVETRLVGIDEFGTLYRYAYGFLGDKGEGSDEVMPLDPDAHFL